MENLRIYNGENEDLIDKVRALVYAEAEKPAEEMDDCFVSECVDFLMELEERQVLTEEKTSKNVARILSRTNRKHISLKRLIMVACIVIFLLLLFSISPLANDGSIWDMPELKYNDIISKMSVGESGYFDGYEIIRDGDSVRYKSIKKLQKKVNPGEILYPEVFPDGETLEYINYSPESVLGRRITFAPETGDSRVTIKLDSGLPPEIYEFGRPSEIIAGIECYVLDEEGREFVQCDFEYKGKGYCVTSDSYENIVLIIENLKESKR